MIELRPLYADLTFLSPLSEDRAASLVRFVAAGEPSSVLDIGCGWGELLLRTVAAVPRAIGLGADLESMRVAEASRRALERGVGDRVRFEARDGSDVAGRFDAVVCVGASHVWGPPVEAARPLDYAAALGALRGLLEPGGRLVYGEAIWSAEPTPAAIAALSGLDDEFLRLDELIALAEAHGFEVLGVEEATQQEWDAFEEGFVGRLAWWLAEHSDEDPEAGEVRAQLSDQRERYLNGYRGILGLAYLKLVAV